MAGNASSTGSADGNGPSATFNLPIGIITDGTNLYVTDTSNNLIRKIRLSNTYVTTLAGTGSAGSNDGGDSNSTTPAEFNNPYGITINTPGTNLYVSDASNHLIRKIVISTKVVTTIAGTPSLYGCMDGTGSDSLFHNPQGIFCYNRKLYISDSANNAIRVITP